MLIPRSLDAYAVQYWPDGPIAQPASPAPDAIAIVTAFFDISRGDWSEASSEVASKYRRSVDDYVGYFAHLTKLKNELIIFTEPHLASRVLDLRREAGLADRTIIFTVDRLFECPIIKPAYDAIAAQMTDDFRSFVWRPTAPEYSKADYVLVNALKSTFACTAIERGAVKAAQLAWIDFGYVRDPQCFDPSVEWRYDGGDRMNLFNIFALDTRPIYEVVRGGEVYFQGCHILGPIDAWPRFNIQMSAALQSLIDCNLIDDDQTMLLMAWRREPDSFIVHHRRIDPEYDWRFVFRRFQTGLAPGDEDLPPVRDRRQPSWWRDLKNDVRRKLRKRLRKFAGR